MPSPEFPLLVDRPAAHMNEEAVMAALDTSDATKRAADAGVPEGPEVLDHEPGKELQVAEEIEHRPETIGPEQSPVEQAQQSPASDRDQTAGEKLQPDGTAPHHDEERHEQELGTDGVTDKEVPVGEVEAKKQVAHAAGEIALEKAEPAGEEPRTSQGASPENRQQPETRNDTPDEQGGADEDNDGPRGSDTERIAASRQDAQNTQRLQVTDGGGGDDRPHNETTAEGDDGPEYLSYEQYLERARPYIDIAENGDIRLLDSKTGSPLDEGSIPQVLQEDPSLQRGYEFLIRNGEVVDARLLLSKHTKDTDLAEAGIDLNIEAKRLAEQRGVLFVEGVFPTSDEKRERLNEFGQRSHLVYPELGQAKSELRAQKTGVYSFDAEVGIQLAGTGVQVEFPDFVRRQSDDPADQEMARLDSLYGAHLIPPEDDQEEIKARHAFIAVEAASVRYRDQYWVGKVGRELSSFIRLDRQRPLYAGMLIGAGHRNIGHHLNGFGVNRVSYRGIDIGEVPGMAYMSRVLQGARTGILTRDQLEGIRHSF